MHNHLVLGTVNFGMPYGPNKYQVPGDEVQKILKLADQHDMMLDTAAAYGNAENIIGHYGYSGDIITKLPPWCTADQVFVLLQERRQRLQLDKISTILLHTETQVYDMYLVAALVEAKKRGLVDNIGVSVYNPGIAITAAKMGFDAIQIPFNVFDNILYFTDFFNIADDNQITIYARSSFLQGYLLTPSKIQGINNKWPNFSKNLQIFKEISIKYGFSLEQMALLLTRYTPGVDYVVVGVDSVNQLQQNLDLLNTVSLADLFKDGTCSIIELLYQFESLNYQIPSLWVENTKGAN